MPYSKGKPTKGGIVFSVHYTSMNCRFVIWASTTWDTSGPTGFKGELGKQLEKLKDPEIAAFPAIPNDDFPNIEQEVAKNFSRDQSLLFQACTAVISGDCASALATASLGPVNHSRWLTTAIRILF